MFGNKIKTITDFIFIKHQLNQKGLLIIPGTHRESLVKKALKVYQKGFAKYIITTGGVKNKQGVTESQEQKNYLIKHKVLAKIIFSENKSTNTKENAVYAKKIIKRYKLDDRVLILIGKTYHARRLYMTFKKQFPNSDIRIIPTIDDRNITRNNWYKDKNKTRKVFEVVRS